ncbi:hypothetical protein [Alicyclobacillus dauci]|uniref:Uncharacterized protein n=1 Tax=Alicyclobacillus dauci TaxID=1475485 RepID=A0ABY6YZW8_9BACL|nr:hypothetical protein [Alicyclobacillus dauci]WAH36009.1 hypothetical protein NZD86_17360 [Alicyclobacillus dauci]
MNKRGQNPLDVFQLMKRFPQFQRMMTETGRLNERTESSRKKNMSDEEETR